MRGAIVRFFLFVLAAALLVMCGSNALRTQSAPVRQAPLFYPFAVIDDREALLPHLHYVLNLDCVDKKHNSVELSFYFVKERGDSLFWVECVEMVPIALLDTACCRTRRSR